MKSAVEASVQLTHFAAGTDRLLLAFDVKVFSASLTVTLMASHAWHDAMPMCFHR